MTLEEKIEELRRRHARAEAGGGEQRRARQHAESKLSARERVDLLFDEGTFEEVGKFVEHNCRDFGMEAQRVPGDGVVTGYGLIHNRLAYAFAQDFTVFGGSLSESNAAKICKVMDLALKVGAPLVASTIPAARAFRKALPRSRAMRTSFCATLWLPEWFRRFPPSWAPARAARSIHPPSRISS